MKQKEFIPLETYRLSLRKLKDSDWKSVSFLRSDRRVNQFVKRKNADTQEKALDFIQKTGLQEGKGELFYWSISLKDHSEMIGSICLWNFSEDKRTAEIGYDLKPEFQNKGIMSEALQEVLKFGFHNLHLEKIEAFTQGNNESSKRLLAKNLFLLNEKRKDEYNPENLIFEIYRH